MPDGQDVVRSHAVLLQSIDDTPAPPGSLAFWWLGQQTFIVKAGGVRLFFDPYLAENPRRNKPPLLTPEECSEFDLVFCSHDHSDHLDPTAIGGIARASRALFVAPRALGDRMIALGVPPERFVGLNGGESIDLLGANVAAIPAAHEFLDLTSEGLNPYLSYIVRAGGVGLYHAGDTVWWEGMQRELATHAPLDVAFVPINGRDGERYRRGCIGNLSFAEACDLVGPLPVGLAVPSHYDMFDGNREDPARFVDYLEAKYPAVRSWVGPAGTAVVVRAGGEFTAL